MKRSLVALAALALLGANAAIAQERGPVQACQFLGATSGERPAWMDSVGVVRAERAVVPGSTPEIVIRTVTLRNGSTRTMYFDGVGPATPALWTPVADETSWRLLSLSCLSGRRAHKLAPGAELRYTFSTTADEDDLVVGIVMSVDGDPGWAVARPASEKAGLLAFSVSPTTAQNP